MANHKKVSSIFVITLSLLYLIVSLFLITYSALNQKMECARRFLSQEEIAQIKSLKVSCDNFHVTFLVINIFFNFSFKRRNNNRLICFKEGFNPNDDDEDVESDEVQKLANEQEDKDDNTRDEESENGVSENETDDQDVSSYLLKKS